MPKTICIAPAHGGYDRGVKSKNGAEEAPMVLTIGLGLEALLQGAGIRTNMSRTTDTAAGGTTRLLDTLKAEVESAEDADLLLELHVAGGEGHGAEAYVKPQSDVFTLAQTLVGDLDQAGLGTHGEAVKYGSQLYVISNSNVPVIVLQMGYIDGSDGEFLKSHIQYMAGILAPALIAWAGGKKENTPNTRIINDTAGMPAEDAATWAADAGILPRVDGYFLPDRPVNRSELAQALHRLYRLGNKPVGEKDFPTQK